MKTQASRGDIALDQLYCWSNPTLGAEPSGVVHLRDAYLARRRGIATTATQLAYRVPDLPQDTTVSDAVARLRTAHSQIALIRDGVGVVTGLVTLDDLLTTLLVPA